MRITEEQIINLIQAYHQKTISEEGIRSLNDWLNSTPNSENEFANYLALLKEGEIISRVNTIDKDEAWNNISKEVMKINSINKTRKLRQWLAYAAAAVVIFAVSYIMVFQKQDQYDFSKNYNFDAIASVGSNKATLTLEGGQVLSLNEETASVIAEEYGTLIYKDSTNRIIYSNANTLEAKLTYNRIDVPRGGEYLLTLADGTKVWLNSESSLKYPVQFVSDNREVELIGEAYFEVAHDASKPFLVKAGNAEVKVLGTKFNISSYTNEACLATTLVEGSVEFNMLGKTQLLKPGFQIQVKKGENNFQLNKVETEFYTSWTEGVFRFKNQPLEKICNQFSRWYNVEFLFTEDEYRELKFTGAVKREKPISFSLNMIEKMANIKFAIEGHKIIVGRANE